MPLSFLTDGRYSAGMVRDESSWLLPAGATYDQLNLLNDRQGILRQRGGTTALVSGAQTAFCTSMGFCYSQDSTPIEQLYGINGKTSVPVVINKTTGVMTQTGVGAAGTHGRPVRHFGFLCFPSTSTTDATYNSVWLAGQTNNTIFVTTVGSNITTGNPQITLTGADVTTNIQVGAMVYGFTATNYYIGRVISVDTTKLFSVWPTPTTTFAPAGTNLTTGATLGQVTSLMSSGGACAASFQNRILFGGVNPQGTTPAVTPITRYDRRVSYSPLPTEHGGFNGDTTKPIDGAPFVWRDQYPALNYFDVPGSDPIVALEPIDDGRLLILTTTDVIILSGNLVTQLATTSPTITYDIYPFDVTSGCLSDLSVMRTPAGIMWAGAEGVFAYWPPIRRSLAHTGMRNLMDGKILTYWQSLVNPSSGSFVIHGAAYAQNHYFISGTSNGVTWSLCCNLNTNAWTRLSGAGTDIFMGARRPSIPQQTFILRWWDQTGAAPSMTNGQTGRAESMFAPYVAGATKTDMDGSAVPVSVTTRTITGDAETQKMFQRAVVEYQQSSTTAAVTVTGQSTIDAADTDASRTRALGSLSNTATSTITNATNASPIVVTTSAVHGLQTDDFVDVDAVLGNLNANGQYRIAVLSTTTFSLVGSSGSAAYTSGGKVKKRTEQTFSTSPINKGQGASLTLAGSPNNFELHGVKLAVLQQEQVSA